MSKNIITGIDIGTYHVKVVIADAGEKNEKGLPKIIGAGISDSHGLRHGYVTNVKDVAESIKQAVALAEETDAVRRERIPHLLCLWCCCWLQGR